MTSRYEREAYQFLAVYRFLAYALAVMFTQVVPSMSGMTNVQLIILLVTLGVYTALKALFPLRWRAKSLMTYLILLGDFLLAILLVVYTNGLNSSFLLYSLTPIMTAALLFEERIALSLAAIATISLSVSHLALSQFTERFVWVMQGHNLTLLIVYALFSFVVASVPYRINLNIRRRIARELHDGVAQSLSYLNLKTRKVSDSVSNQNTVEAIQELGEVREVVQDTYEDIRESIDQLSTETKTLPIIPAMTNYIREFSNNNGIQVDLNIPRSFTRLSPVAELQLLRISQEALTNVRRHARASEVKVNLEYTTQAVEMSIRDNGCGFNLEDLEKVPPGYHGLNIIKERAEGLGGSVDIDTAPGRGAEIRISLPIDKVRM